MTKIKTPRTKFKVPSPITKYELEDVSNNLEKSLDKTTKDNLSERSLNALIENYCRIEGTMIQARLQQCKILREIRRRFGDNDVAFGQFFKKESTPSLMTEIEPLTRTRMIQVADFFDARDISGLKWTVAIALAQPKYSNNNVAEITYQEIINNGDISVVEVRNRLEELYHQNKINNDSAIEGEYQVVSDEKSIAESAATQSMQETIVTDEKKDEFIPIVIPSKLDNIDSLEEIIIKLCEPFSVLDILSLLRKLIRKFQPKLHNK